VSEATSPPPVLPLEQPAASYQAVDRGPRSIVDEIVASVIVAAVIAALGAPIGLLWRLLAPQVELVQTTGGPYPLEPEPEGYVADEGWFMLLAAIAGVLLAIGVWRFLRRYRGPGMVAALVVGSAGGSVLAAWLGNKIGYADYLHLAQTAPVGTHIFRPVKVRLADVGLWFGAIPRVRGIVLLQALVAAGLYTAFAGFSYNASLQPGPEPDEYDRTEYPQADFSPSDPPTGPQPMPWPEPAATANPPAPFPEPSSLHPDNPGANDR
jgi:hypothetical protein